MEISQVRKVFPKALLWVTASLGPDGKAIFKAKVPDTITSWVASAFSTSLTSGLGVAPFTSLLKVFMPFFVSLTYPRSVTRHEQFVVQATVFNYLPSDLEVKVTLKGQIEFKSIIIYENGTEILVTGNQETAVAVKSGEQGVAYFPMLSTALGFVDFEVSAQSTVAADGVYGQIIVKPEGAPVSYNVPVFVNIDSNSTQKFEKSFTFTLPPSVVVGSERARVKASGDLIGSSSLMSFITLPTGCGEQSLARFAPDLYIAQYLNATGQLTHASKGHIIEVLEAGYQRQLTYRRFDGGFSPFGNYDETGSTWLTALTFRILSEASEFIYVDPLILSTSVMWIIDRQNLEGSFNEFGKVLDKNTQGTGTGPALTAFVLLSLLDAENYVEKEACLKEGGFRCNYYERWGNATEKARTNLENLVASNAIGDQFPLALVSYALSKAKSPASNTALEKLLTFSQSGGGLLHWEANSTTFEPMQSHYFKWRPPRIQARPIDILITSYAILTYTQLGRIDEALPAVRWLTTQRNAQGGFSSSQDTVVGLQALSAFAAKSLLPETDLQIVVTAPTPLSTFYVTRENALYLQITELSGAPQEISISASGTGFALVDVDYRFNVASEVTTPSFDVSTVLLDDGINSFNLMICTKWLLKKETGMVVQEISIPSGFQPDLSTLGNVAGLKRSERKGGVVAIYFDKIGSSSLCYSLRMVRESKVAKSQSSYVKTFSYYSPDDQSTVFYLPKALRDSNICDVCVGCCPWLLQ
ncbi:unnamed protein product [Lymnaea stagnalis]|uniref:Uncharacterized protein n=1 Tax=Lymnaea stagnalis TaxID=6523 RepID=A0AAV2HG22_LYMST